MAITQVQGRVIAGGVLVSWKDSNEDDYTLTVTEYDLTEPDSPTVRTVELTAPDSPLQWFDDDLEDTTDRVVYLITNDNDAETGTVTVNLDSTWTYGEIDPSESAARYTTLASVKESLGIPSADTNRDDEITNAILSAESWIDDYCGRSFVASDPSANPEYSDIPNRVKRAALLLSTAFYTAQMSPDTIDPFEADLRSERNSNMAIQLLYGYRKEWGIA